MPVERVNVLVPGFFEGLLDHSGLIDIVPKSSGTPFGRAACRERNEELVQFFLRQKVVPGLHFDIVRGVEIGII